MSHGDVHAQSKDKEPWKQGCACSGTNREPVWSESRECGRGKEMSSEISRAGGGDAVACEVLLPGRIAALDELSLNPSGQESQKR